MKTKQLDSYRPYDWSQSGRPVQPYLVDPITVVARQPRAPKSMVPHDLRYLVDPIHVELRRLRSLDSFVEFASTFGLHEFLNWVQTEMSKGLSPPSAFSTMEHLLDRYESGIRAFTVGELGHAWSSLPAGAVRTKTDSLKRAFDYANRHSVDSNPARALRGVLAMAWEQQELGVELGLDETTQTPIVYERPADIWSRGWFELIDDIRAGRVVKACVVDGEYFIPRRRNRRFCSASCRSTAYERRRSRDPERIAAQKARYQRRKKASRRRPGE